LPNFKVIDEICACPLALIGAVASNGKGAINRYFDERNRHFHEHPRRAGKRIWGKERVPSEFADGNCCKDPRFR